MSLRADGVLFAAVFDRNLGPTPSPLRAYSQVTACPALGSPFSLSMCSVHLLLDC